MCVCQDTKNNVVRKGNNIQIHTIGDKRELGKCDKMSFPPLTLPPEDTNRLVSEPDVPDPDVSRAPCFTFTFTFIYVLSFIMIPKTCLSFKARVCTASNISVIDYFTDH